MINLPKLMPPPAVRPSHLPAKTKWLAGEGAGSWFVIEETGRDRQYAVQRFAPGGQLECEGLFTADGELNLEMDYTITYPSHCLKVTVIQGKRRVQLIN